MSKKFLSGINVTGTATLNTVANAGLDTDKFLVLDAAGNVDYRTGAELRLDIGADVVSKVQHEVKLGESMTIGTPVYVPLAQDSGTNMTVVKASNASEATSSKTMGLIASSGITNDLVQVITEGLLAGLNTNGATKGDPVWLGVNGALIFGLANKPVAPAHLVFIGIVTRANSNNGEIFVKIQNGFEMNELHNYLEGSVQNNEVIVYESATSLYKPKTIPTILGYTPVPDSRTITINGTTYDLSANRSWTVSANQNARTEYEFTTDGTTATYSAVYSVGQVDVFYNGSKLASTEFTATNGTSVTLGFTPPSGQLVEVVAWETGGGVSSGRTLTINGTTYDLSTNRSWTIDNASLGAQAQLNGTGLVRMSGTTVSYDNANYATQSYVTTAVSNLVNSAPSTLDTLNELAAALGNDANFATTVTNSIATKLPLSGGTLTGPLNGTSVSLSSTISATRFISNVTNGYGLVLNRPLVSNYNGISLQTAGVAQWYVGMRENLSSNNYIIYNENGTDALTISKSNSLATFSSASSQSIRITSSFALSSGYADAFQMLFGNQTGGGLSLNIGKSESTRNLAKMVYTHISDGSTSNRLGFGFYDADGLLNILASGSVGIGTATPGAYILALDYNASNAAVMSIKNSSASGYSGAHILNNSGQVMGHWGYANGSTGGALTDTVYFGSTASKTVAFTTADTIRMAINPSGYVTRPFQPAFMAYSGGVSISGGTWQLISNSITTEAYDIGSNYSGGRFTAPVSGRYYFFFGGWTTINSNGERYAVSFVVNSGSTYYISGGNYCITDSPLSGATIVHNLNAGDYVELHCFSAVGGTWGGGHGVWWGGYLL